MSTSSLYNVTEKFNVYALGPALDLLQGIFEVQAEERNNSPFFPLSAAIVSMQVGWSCRLRFTKDLISFENAVWARMLASLGGCRINCVCDWSWNQPYRSTVRDGTASSLFV
jgi:hypothetical protein